MHKLSNDPQKLPCTPRLGLQKQDRLPQCTLPACQPWGLLQTAQEFRMGIRPGLQLKGDFSPPLFQLLIVWDRDPGVLRLPLSSSESHVWMTCLLGFWGHNPKTSLSVFQRKTRMSLEQRCTKLKHYRKMEGHKTELIFHLRGTLDGMNCC